MIVQFTDSVTATPVYVNPSYVTSLRPDPTDPLKVTIVRLQDGESIRVRGEHQAVASRLDGPS